jgi:hypothetical protein
MKTSPISRKLAVVSNTIKIDFGAIFAVLVGDPVRPLGQNGFCGLT